MRAAAVLPALAAPAQLAASPAMAGPADGNVIWAGICGKPGARIAIPLGSGDDRDENRCPGACHAALCRKQAVSDGARGARI